MWRYDGERGRRAPCDSVSTYTRQHVLDTRERIDGFTVYDQYMFLFEYLREFLIADLKFYPSFVEGKSFPLSLENVL